MPSFNGKDPERNLWQTLKCMDPKIHVIKGPIKFLILYIYTFYSFTPGHGRSRICYIEIINGIQYN